MELGVLFVTNASWGTRVFDDDVDIKVTLLGDTVGNANYYI